MFLCQSQSLSSLTTTLSSWRWYYDEAFKQYSGLQEAEEASQDEQMLSSGLSTLDNAQSTQ